MRYKIYLDAGHGKNTPNKVSPTGVSEWSLNNDVCNYIKNNLAKYNCDIYRCDDITGETDPTPVSTRLDAAEIGKADVCISIHHAIAKDGTFETGNSYSGVEVFISKNYTAASKELGHTILQNLTINTGLKNRGLKVSNMTMATSKSFPTVVVEGGCINNESDLAYVCSEKGKKAYAKAISSALIAFLKLSKDDEDSGVGGGVQPTTYTVQEQKTVDKVSVDKEHAVLASAISECDKRVGAKVVDNEGNVVHESKKASPVVENKYVIVNNVRGTKMRRHTNSVSAIITNLTYNKKLILVSKTTPSWWKCRTLDGRYEGFVFANTLKES